MKRPPIKVTARQMRSLRGGRRVRRRVRVSPETCTVLGYKVRATDAMWSGLQLDHPGVRALGKASIMVYLCGNDAPDDPHLSVPWVHPEDAASGMEPDCWYRVRPIYKLGSRPMVESGEERARVTVIAVEMAPDAFVLTLQPSSA